MLFNSIEFLIFLPTVFVLYWFVFSRHLKAQNILLLVASYVFYGWWDYRFLALIFFSSMVDYSLGLALSKVDASGRRKSLLAVSLAVNLGLLGIFKYYNFFIDNLITAFQSVGIEMNIRSLNIILPVGISFYTFQTLSYTIDVYRKKLEPTKDVLSFFAFVSFFPQLVAGPIERAGNLLPQFYKARVFSNKLAQDGLKQILWGLFKKVVIADTLSGFVEQIFGNPDLVSTPVLISGAVFFAFQIYCDFSGYSDIAIGTAKLFGFRLMINFKYPYFSRDIAEFWRRWHISLSTWFRDYLYIPLGGSRGSDGSKLRNVLIIFVVSGFWHGANWTFLFWGFLNGIYFLPLLLRKSNRKHLEPISGRTLPSLREFFQILATFGLTTFAWIFFRSENITAAFDYISRMAQFEVTPYPNAYFEGLILIIALILIEWPKKKLEHPLHFEKSNIVVRYAAYSLLLYMVIAYVSTDANQFIYFQF